MSLFAPLVIGHIFIYLEEEQVENMAACAAGGHELP
jgi:hypothetical protein